jgi:4-deoxy-L-threo-5-hexosulose-uronate ketol-isomerase
MAQQFMTQYYACSPEETATMDTGALRGRFLLENLFIGGQINLAYTHYDRMIAGGAVPLKQPLMLENPAALKSDFFLERRELGVLNIGGPGRIIADGEDFDLEKLDGLYLGKNTRAVSFESLNANQPARFFLLSTPAHAIFPTRRMTASEAAPVQLGEQASANRRTIYKYIHPDGIGSCQLVMGLTVLQEGNVWNTMPPHTHDRRSEIYCYFDVAEGQRVLHLMGPAESTRAIWVADGQAVVSPPWSIHAGCGTRAYAFIWAMAGENQSFSDMDFINISDLK